MYRVKAIVLAKPDTPADVIVGRITSYPRIGKELKVYIKDADGEVEANLGHIFNLEDYNGVMLIQASAVIQLWLLPEPQAPKLTLVRNDDDEETTDAPDLDVRNANVRR